jgi:glycosyltransferase involved in cell wall biosynthesis
VRVVLLAETFAPRMGYLQNLLPRYLAREGVEVHVLTLDLAPYYQTKEYGRTYSTFHANAGLVAGMVLTLDNFTLHVLPHRKLFGYVRMQGFFSKIRELEPDIVTVSVSIGWLALDAAIGSALFGYRLFTGNHTGSSVFDLARLSWSEAPVRRAKSWIMRALPGRFVSLFAERCYAATVDCADVARRFFGVQSHKIEVLHLGVDTDVFHAIADQEELASRFDLRRELHVRDHEILCIYTGKLTGKKNAALLARAIESLRSQGAPYRGLFIGEGPQAREIEARDGCTRLDFMDYQQLGRYYRAADVGVWPTDESTSMLDAAACGLPLIVSNGIGYFDHVEGNGLVYRMNDINDLVEKLRMLEATQFRAQLGGRGAQKMAQNFSWQRAARVRCRHFREALPR